MTKIERLQRFEAIRQFEQEAFTENLAFARLPEWKQAQLEGDYHYNKFDLDREEY